MVFELDKKIIGFPDPHLGEEDGLLAVGGDLSVDRLLTAYSYGIFPWYSFRDAPMIEWWCPMKRFVIFPKEIHISHSMRQLMKKDQFKLSFDLAFDDVIRNCSQLRINMEGAWLGDDMIKAYTELHRQGFAKSVEVWDENDQLVGGLYGVTIGRCFFGESMFSLVPNASKMALIFLATIMEDSDCLMIDCQFHTPHLESMGGRYISYEEYMGYINRHTQ